MIHFWDMDHTIINNDCDVSWKDFMIAKGLAPSSANDEADKFYQDYLNMCLDYNEFIQFQLREFQGKSPEEIDELSLEHFDKYVKDKIYPEAVKMIEAQKASGEVVCLITATNSYIAKPLAAYLGIPHILATVPELADGTFTGNFVGEYCCGAGKVGYIKDFCEEQGLNFSEAKYYGDSNNDIPIFEALNHACAVNPGEKLRAEAQANKWEILDFSL